jgi:hypothetical protein
MSCGELWGFGLPYGSKVRLLTLSSQQVTNYSPVYRSFILASCMATLATRKCMKFLNARRPKRSAASARPSAEGQANDLPQTVVVLFSTQVLFRCYWCHFAVISGSRSPEPRLHNTKRSVSS